MSQNWAESEGEVVPTFTGPNRPVYPNPTHGERAAELQEMLGDLTATPQTEETTSDEIIDPTTIIAKAREVLGVQDTEVKPANSDPDNSRITRTYIMNRPSSRRR